MRSLQLILRNKTGLIGLVLLIAILVCAIFAPWIAPYPKDAQRSVHLDRMLQAPSRDHPFGTDDMGRDLLSRIVYGARLSLAIGVVSIGCSVVVGLFVGLIAGFFGGWIDNVLMRIVDIFMSVPSVILGMAIAVALKPGLRNVIIAVALVFWPATARLMRGAVLSVREEMYVEAVRAMGANAWRIMFRHIMPNCISSVVVHATIQVGWAILLSATLSFVGVGVQAPLPEWGLLTSSGRQYMMIAWWYATLPGFAIVLTVMAFNLVGDALRDALDPRMRGR
jgi:peptide/nickel transport system permease protein